MSRLLGTVQIRAPWPLSLKVPVRSLCTTCGPVQSDVEAVVLLASHERYRLAPVPMIFETGA